MSRFNLKSIFSWVDSHIIDYPTAMIILQNARMSILVFCFSSYLLFLVSPIFGILSLLIFTVYLLYNKNFKGIFFIWGSFFFTWYLAFTACLVGYNKAIWIGHIGINNSLEETFDLLLYIIKEYPSDSIRGNFCVQTVLVWGGLSNKVGFSFYIPSIFHPFKWIWAIVKSALGGSKPSAECAPERPVRDKEEESPYYPPPSPTSPFPSSDNNWGSKPKWSTSKHENESASSMAASSDLPLTPLEGFRQAQKQVREEGKKPWGTYGYATVSKTKSESTYFELSLPWAKTKIVVAGHYESIVDLKTDSKKKN